MEVISEASDHSRIAAHTCAVKITDHVVSRNIALLGKRFHLAYGVTAVPHILGPDSFSI